MCALPPNYGMTMAWLWHCKNTPCLAPNPISDNNPSSVLCHYSMVILGSQRPLHFKSSDMRRIHPVLILLYFLTVCMSLPKIARQVLQLKSLLAKCTWTIIRVRKKSSLHIGTVKCVNCELCQTHTHSRLKVRPSIIPINHQRNAATNVLNPHLPPNKVF